MENQSPKRLGQERSNSPSYNRFERSGFSIEKNMYNQENFKHMGHYASEMNYRTPEQRREDERRYHEESLKKFEKNIWKPTIGQSVSIAEFTSHFISDVQFSHLELGQMLHWLVVRRIKKENNEIYISFYSDKDAKKINFKDPRSYFQCSAEWFRANYFIPAISDTQPSK